MDTPTNTRENLHELLKDFHTAMMLVRSNEAYIQGRPMAIAKLEENADIFFITSIDSPKIDAIETYSSVTLTFQNASQFVSLSGRAMVEQDKTMIAELWTEPMKLWFPKGKDDPAICLIHFTPEVGEYWNNAGVQGMKYAVEAVKAYVKGETAKTDELQHAKVKL